MAAAPVLHTEHFLNDCSTRSDRHAFNSPTINKWGELNKETPPPRLEAGLMARGSEMDHHTIDREELPPPPKPHPQHFLRLISPLGWVGGNEEHV